MVSSDACGECSVASVWRSVWRDGSWLVMHSGDVMQVRERLMAGEGERGSMSLVRSLALRWCLGQECS